MKIRKRMTAAVACAVLLGVVSGCSGAAPGAASSGGGAYESAFYDNSFSSPQTLSGSVQADISTAPDGYIGLSAVSEKKIKAQLALGESTYTYTIPGDGSAVFLPLQCGSGTYALKVLENTVDDKYIQLAAISVPAQLKDEFGPFLHSNVIVSFTRESACVEKAANLAAASDDEVELMTQVYKFICKNIKYDNKLAATVSAGYVPEPDKTLDSGKGICFDYASLAAAMLRSQGIPAKVITGYAGKEALYHAWNEVYLEESGWITVELKIDPGNWNRLDLTFAAAGQSESIYVDRYVY